MINRIYEGSSITTMDNTCVICTEEIGKDRATTECGHTFHTRCFANNIALNVGSEAGTTRHLCVLCRASVCEPVQTSKNITIRLDDLTVNVEVLSNTNAGWADYCEEIEKKNASLETTICQSQWAWSNKCARLTEELETLHTNYRKEKFISDRRLAVIRSRLPSIGFGTAVVRIQNWLRCARARKTATLERHRQAWTIYKNIAEECFIFETSTHDPVPDSTNINIHSIRTVHTGGISHINIISNES